MKTQQGVVNKFTLCGASPLPVVVIVIAAVVANAFVFVFDDRVVIIVDVAFNVVFPLSFPLSRLFGYSISSHH